jgi:hypothetical protein
LIKSICKWDPYGVIVSEFTGKIAEELEQGQSFMVEIEKLVSKKSNF